MASSSEGEMVIDPIHQFQIFDLFGGEKLGFLSFTNSSLWMVIIFAAAIALFLIGSRGRAIVPSRLQSLAEVIYDFIRKMVRDVAGEEGLRYFPYIFTLFVFIAFANLLGLIPNSFTVTSHFAVTGALALTVFVTVTAIGFWKHGLHFLSFFVPQDAPLVLKPVLAVIEVIAYFVRPLSHSVRLGANMIAGHAILKVFAAFATSAAVYGLSGMTALVSGLSVAAMVPLFALELLVALVQAYIFVILTTIYLNDALHMH
ncbi:MAG: F0F1 ATP synthase subunit A [Neomegalonema sp.]|nr:F0F1 ATP synthase subunit A [Neomegalonema sp.]